MLHTYGYDCCTCKFSLQATIDHHGPSRYSCHYTVSINYCIKTFYCNDSKITEFEIIDTPKLLYCLCGNIQIDYIMVVGLEQEDGIFFITSTALERSPHLIKSRSRNKHRNPWVGWCVSSWQPWFWPMYSINDKHTIHYSCNLSNWNKLFLLDIYIKSWCGHAGVLDYLVLLSLPVWFQVYISIVEFSILYIKMWI